MDFEPKEIISQEDLEGLSVLEAARNEKAEEIQARLNAGAYLESGDLGFANGELITGARRQYLDALRMLARMMEREDFEFARSFGQAMYKKFKAKRLRILRQHTRELQDEARQVHARRLDRIDRGHHWSEYAPLLKDRFHSECAFFKLKVAAALLALDLPGWIDVEFNVGAIARFVSDGGLFAKPQTQSP
jgi:hypothetical protein